MKKIIISATILIFLIQSVEARNNFYWGHCTWYVASKADVNWRGNAKDWYNNAYNSGRDVGYNPIEGSIIVFNGPGYNYLYGHVAIVEKVIGNNIIISEMNYRKLNQITIRVVNRYDNNIIGYIY